MIWNLNLGPVNWANPFAASVNRKRRQADDGESPASKRPKKPSLALRRLIADAQEEKELKMEALKRWQPDITPDEQDFLSKLAEFERKLEDADETVDNILNKNFPAEQRELLVPVAADRNPHLAKIQEHNTKQYQDMLKSSGFKDWRNRADIPFKLTLAYFGVPTEPLGLMGLFDRTFDDDWSDGEEDIPVAQPHVRNLRFANQYLHRMYAFDSMRNADPLLETYHVFDNYLAPPREAQVPRSSDAFSALGLRGGGDDDDVEDDLYIHQHYHTTLGGEEEMDASYEWITLYGYQGQVAFRLNSLHTFVDAVDRLLCLDNRAGVAYKLLMHDRRKKPSQTSWKAKTISCRGVGNFDADREVLQWVNRELPNYERGKGKSGTNAILFVMGYREPVPSRWEPNLVEDHVLRFKLQWRDVEELGRPDLAYLRVPQNVSTVEYTNQYGPWMANVCRVLAPGRIPGRPGRPAIPDAFICLKNYPSHNKHIGSYGGLAFLPLLWDSIVKSWEKDPLKTVTLQAITTNEGFSDRFFLFLPGDSSGYGYKNFIRHTDASNPEVVESVILELVKHSMSAESYSQLTGVSVTIPGESALAPLDEVQDSFVPAVIFLPVPKEGEDPAKEAAGPIVSRLKFLAAMVNQRKTVSPAKNGLQMYPSFISVRPVFRDYRIRDASDPDSYISQDPASCSLQQFRRHVRDDLGIPLDTAPYIEIRQKPKPADPRLKDRATDKPRFIITPYTTQNEWHLIRNWIVEPDIYVSVKDTSVQPILGTNTEQPFGYFDIYNLPARDLYRHVLEVHYPKKQRYYDYQMDAKNASERLPTREPAGEARKNVRDPLSKKPPTSQPDADTAARPGTVIRASSKKAGYSLDFMHDPAYTDLQKALQMREYSYFHPLDVRMENKIPINAPPLEHIVKKGSSTPKMAVGVLTPSETRTLQRHYYRMRNILLDRVQKCPHARCDYTFAVTQEAELQRHLSDAHATKEKCPFCESLDFPFWSKSQQAVHIKDAHSDLVPSNVKLSSPTTPTGPNFETEVDPAPEPQGLQTTGFDSWGEEPEPTGDDTFKLFIDEEEPTKLTTKRMKSSASRPKPRKAGVRKPLAKSQRPAMPSPLDGEDNWLYCARCGRHHVILNSDLDRTQHDQICYFGALDEYHEDDPEDDWEVCTECGVHIPVAAGGEHSPHKPGLHPNKQYCYKCGLGLGQFVEDYRNLHVGTCKGYGSGSHRQGDFQFCPWCEKSFDDGGVEVAGEWYKHVQKCSRRSKSVGLGGATVSMAGALALAFGDDEDEEDSELSDLEEEVPDVDVEVEADEGTKEPGDDGYVQVAAVSPIKTRSGVTTRARTGTRTTPTLKAKEAGILVSPRKPATRKRKTSVEEDVDEGRLSSRNVTFNQVVDVREIPPRPTRAAATRPNRRRT